MLDRSRRRTLLLPLLALLVLAGQQPLAISQPESRLLVIAHPSVQEKSVDIDELRAAFLRKRLQWSGGARIIPINQPPGSASRNAFDSAILGFNQQQVARYWIDARIRWGLQAPQVVPGDATVVQVVRALPGSISYVSADQSSSGVRVLARIEGGQVRAP